MRGGAPARRNGEDRPVRIVWRDEIDFEAHAALQQRVFGETLDENGIPRERLGASVFRWKLDPPAGPGCTAVVEDARQVVATVSAYPVELASRETRVRGWHFCDAATAPEARGKGYFSAVLRELRRVIAPSDWVFAFPNGQSRRAFDNEHYHPVHEVPLWFRPVMGPVAPPDTVHEISEFGPAHDELAARFAATRGLTPLRSSAYLNWRYAAHPYFRYRCFEWRGERGAEGILVVHPMKARGRVSLWVMELMATDARGEAELAKAARAWAHRLGCGVVLAMATPKLKASFRLPACFLPKNHVLMVHRGGASERLESSDSWAVYTGDWDTF